MRFYFHYKHVVKNHFSTSLSTLVIPCGTAISSMRKLISRVIKMIIHTEDKVLPVTSLTLDYIVKDIL